MSEASAAIALTVAVVAATVGYAAVRGEETIQPIDLDASTVRLERWFDQSTYEWALFPMKDFDSYVPFDRKESDKCVTLVDRTGLKRDELARLQGLRVVITGVAVRYRDLTDGTTAADRLLAKKYYEDVRVENFCYREYIFVVRGVKMA